MSSEAAKRILRAHKQRHDVYCPKCESKMIKFRLKHQDGLGVYNRWIIEIECEDCQEITFFYESKGWGK